MSDHPITISMPEYLYERARRIAEQTSQSIEHVLVRHLENALTDLPALPPEEQAELDALTHLSDEALWTIAREQMQADRQAHLDALMGKSGQGTLGEAEREEMARLVEIGHRLMLRKAQAAALLAERGYILTPDDLKPNGE